MLGPGAVVLMKEVDSSLLRNDRRPEATCEIRNTRYESKVSFDEAGIDFIFQIQIV